METLNIEQLGNRKLHIMLTSIDETPLVEQAWINLCNDVLVEYQVDFVTYDLDGTDPAAYNPKKLLKILGKCPVPSYPLDMPEAARAAIVHEIDSIEEKAKELASELENVDPSTFKGENLASWIAVLEEEAREKREELDKVIRPRWVAKKVIDMVSRIMEGEEVYFMHFAPARIVESMKDIFKVMDGVSVAVLDLKKEPVQQSKELRLAWV